MTESMGLVQFKLFCILKMLRNVVMKYSSVQMSRHGLKCTVFHLSDIIPAENWTEDLLLDLVLMALKWLQNRIENGFLPCYFTKEKNLLSESVLESHRKTRLVLTLQDLQKESLCGLTKCEKFMRAMYMHFSYPGLIKQYSYRRDEVEKIIILVNYLRHFRRKLDINEKGNSHLECKEELQRKCRLRDIVTQIGVSSDLERLLLERLFDFVLPDWRIFFTPDPEYVYKTVLVSLKQVLVSDE